MSVVRRLIITLVVVASLNATAAIVLSYLDVWIDPRFGRTVLCHGFIAVAAYVLAGSIACIAATENYLSS